MCTGGYMLEQHDLEEGMFSCDICGSADLRPSVEKAGYRYSVCSACGVSVLCPMPEESYLEGLYEDITGVEVDGVKMPERGSREFMEAYSRARDIDLDDIGFEFTEGGSVLDVGCADGIFLRYLKERHGVEGEGVDVSKNMVEKAVDEGLNCFTKNLNELSGPYDVVTIWGAIEHLRSPSESMKEVHRLLADDGELIIQTPCRGVLSEAYGPEWTQYQPPYHVHIFDLDSLKHLLDSTGFVPVKWVRSGAGIADCTNSVKPVFDHVVKDVGIGDTIVLWAKKKLQSQADAA